MTDRDAAAHFQRGNELLDAARPEDALASFDAALALAPDFPEALNNRGNALRRLGRNAEALSSYERALRLKPDLAETLNNRGNALQDIDRVEEALASYEQALILKPDYAAARNNRRNAVQALAARADGLRKVGRLEETAALYRKCLEAEPGDAALHHALVFALVRTSADHATVYEACRDFARRFEPEIERLPHRNARDPDRRLKVGYVSGDFREHSAAHSIEPTIAHHDKRDFEVFCYSTHPTIDHVTRRLMRDADGWRPLVGVSDDEAAALVRRDGIDILVDLSGHTTGNRLLVFARKPAPVQVTWFGLPNTTGLTAMDYRLTNDYSDPPGATEQYHTETLVRLRSSTCFEPARPLPPINVLPALSNGFVTFACFNHLDKITAAAYALWSRILSGLPASRMMFVCDAAGREQVRQAFALHGIGAARLVFQEKVPVLEYLALHNEVDIALDPFPYNGGTISKNSLWMGVPLVTLAGSRAVSRVGLALLSQVRLERLVAHDENDYVRIAMQLARDLPALAEIRATLRQRVQAAPFSDAAACTREVEFAYRMMWRRWCARASVESDGKDAP